MRCEGVPLSWAGIGERSRCVESAFWFRKPTQNAASMLIETLHDSTWRLNQSSTTANLLAGLSAPRLFAERIASLRSLKVLFSPAHRKIESDVKGAGSTGRLL